MVAGAASAVESGLRHGLHELRCIAWYDGMMLVASRDADSLVVPTLYHPLRKTSFRSLMYHSKVLQLMRHSVGIYSHFRLSQCSSTDIQLRVTRTKVECCGEAPSRFANPGVVRLGIALSYALIMIA